MIISFFKTIESDYKIEEKKPFEYFNNNYLEGRKRHGRSKIQFPPTLLMSYYNQTINGLPQT